MKKLQQISISKIFITCVTLKMSLNKPPKNDIYSGFMENAYNFNDELYNNEPINTGYLSTAVKTSSYSRDGLATRDNRIFTRPTTAIRPVGYTSEAGKLYDTFHTQKKAVIVENKKEDLPEEKYKNLELKIITLLEEAILFSTDKKPDLKRSLIKAKEASSLDRTLLKMHEQNLISIPYNYDLTYLVLFNLANIYYRNDMYVEALNTYNLIIKNKMFPIKMRLKMNMGNIYYKMGLYSKAIKMYRMALDQVPKNQKELRFKITHNIGILFIKMGQYYDAATSFEFIMSEKCDFKTGLHLILCYYAIGDVSEIKRSFQMLLDVPLEYDSNKDKYINLNSNNNNNDGNTGPGGMNSAVGARTTDDGTSGGSNYEYILNVIKSDELNAYEMSKKNFIEKNIIISSLLISSIIEDSFDDGYNWCLEKIKSSNYNKISFNLELNKSIMLLKKNDIKKTIENLKYFEKKDAKYSVNAIINLTFIYLLKGDTDNSKTYLNISKTLDTYNPAIYINHGVSELVNNNIIAAKTLFENALDIDATSFEALYNLGLVYKKMGDYDKSMQVYRKIQSSIGHELHAQVIYQIANLYEYLGDYSSALEWYLRLMGLVSFDAGIFKKIGELYEKDNERQHAYQYYYESYKIYPVNLDIVDWIGTYFIDLQIAEKAVVFYEKTVVSNPSDPYYYIRVANCYRKVGNNQKSLHLLQIINKYFPEDLNCLRALVYLTHRHGLNQQHEKYLKMFQNLEKLQETRSRIGSSRPGTSAQRNELRKQYSGNKLAGSDMSGGSNQNSSSIDGNDTKQTVSYIDYLGPLAERPKTGKMNRSEVDLDDDLDPDELLPI